MKTLYLSALPFRADEKLIRELVAPFGKIGRVAVHADWQEPTFEPYALVEMEDPGPAVEALDGKKIGATQLRAHERAR